MAPIQASPPKNAAASGDLVIEVPPDSLGVVVIGRNEGERLRRCLLSLRDAVSMQNVVYVDSASTDGSVALAQDLGATVVSLDLSQKFTAARARNAGLRRLLEDHPDLAFVQFVDGDCEIESGWLQTAQKRLGERAELAVVCGRRRERFPEQSVYNHLCDLEWNTPVGPTKACGGDAMMRVTAVVSVGAYNEMLIAGEEPDLCFRLRANGHGIERIDAPMTIHDAAITKFSQWFKRAARSGHATAERAAIHGAHPERPGVKETASNLVWGVGIPSAIAATLLTLGPAVAGATGASAFSYLFYKSYRFERKRRPAEEARLYAAACVAGKFPEAIGALSYLRNRMMGKQSVLIEYKDADSTANTL